jgi:hypothetical protein
MLALEKDAEIGPRLQNPRVRAAVEEVTSKPWKTVKFIFDREVMSVFQLVSRFLKNASSK